MKSIITMVLMLVSINSMAATSVLLKSRLFIGFAPVEYQGVYSTSILSNGVVEYEDNKGKITKVMTLSKEAVKILTNRINNLKISELQGEDGAQCMDAPGSENSAFVHGTEVKIKTVIGCIEKSMPDALSLNSILDAADTLARTLK